MDEVIHGISWGLGIALILFLTVVAVCAVKASRESQEQERRFEQERWENTNRAERTRAQRKNYQRRSDEMREVRMRQMHRETFTRLWERNNGPWPWDKYGKAPNECNICIACERPLGECTCILVDDPPAFRPNETDVLL